MINSTPPRTICPWSWPTGEAGPCSCRTWRPSKIRSRDLRATGTANGKPAVLVIIFRQPGANIIETVDRVRALLPQLEASIPGSMTLSVVMDRTPVIRASLHDVERTLTISVALVILVVFIFLRSARATSFPSSRCRSR